MWKNYYSNPFTRDSNDELFVKYSKNLSMVNDIALKRLIVEDLEKIGCQWDGERVVCKDVKEIEDPLVMLDEILQDFSKVKNVEVIFVDKIPFEWVSDWAYGFTYKNTIFYRNDRKYTFVYHFVLFHELGHVIQNSYGTEIHREGLNDLFALVTLRKRFKTITPTLKKLLLNMYRYYGRTQMDVYYENELIKEYVQIYKPFGMDGLFTSLKNEGLPMGAALYYLPEVEEYLEVPPDLILSPRTLIFADVLFGKRDYHEIILPKHCKNNVGNYIHKYPEAEKSAMRLSKDLNVPIDCVWYFFEELSNKNIAWIDAFDGRIIKNEKLYSMARYSFSGI